MPTCTHCGASAAEGALFCPACGWTLPQFGIPGSPVPPPGASPVRAAPEPPPPLDWIPPSLVGKAIHCPRCNTLISVRAVVCPVCRTEQPVPVGDAGAGAPR
ncbi:MAG TPA: zinc ribbon domain-containing protein [Thermoplasmata archaeon]|nr:zinc ribbon domain-containing protein [Thermoplasmata archaeon]